ncbi:uncharacterized protein FA14DRAFT_158787 [Meira miltonrushii]|uniref:Uncharacterized protein n=1 Tax=Meira miltonrushii TaxID=1280837 RepID=A0A316V349_9BASI|nr:uncharacterized protein FA14DRAFT_158787 [Meira miltonrushii]PWN31418.1 hypothetical protein FA14DRAFT_158787 [Meira miltonrushii]
MKSTSLLTFACLMAPFLATSGASFSDCRPKYSGNIAINNEQIGITGQYNSLGKVSKGFTPVNFVFYECKIEGYSRSPDEYGFLIANGVDKSKCATAILQGSDKSFATIDHYQCDYNGANKEQINRQLVYANYFRPNGGDAVIDITFQGSPKTETNTGFTMRHASPLRPQKVSKKAQSSSTTRRTTSDMTLYPCMMSLSNRPILSCQANRPRMKRRLRMILERMVSHFQPVLKQFSHLPRRSFELYSAERLFWSKSDNQKVAMLHRCCLLLLHLFFVGIYIPLTQS